MEQYTGGWALNQPPGPPTAIVDGPTVELIFNSSTTATLHIGTQTVPIQRYQFSDQWASPMLNAPRSGWWDEPTQSGRRYFLEVQGNTLFAGGLIYGSSGQPSWFTATGPVDLSGNFSASLTACSAAVNVDGTLQTPVCNPTADTIHLLFSAPWRATITLGKENPVEIRRYRQTEIGWAGPAPSFPLPNPLFLGQSATVKCSQFFDGGCAWFNSNDFRRCPSPERPSAVLAPGDIGLQATESSSEARLVLYFGDQTGDVWLDGVSLMPVQSAGNTP